MYYINGAMLHHNLTSLSWFLVPALINLIDNRIVSESISYKTFEDANDSSELVLGNLTQFKYYCNFGRSRRVESAWMIDTIGVVLCVT